MNFTASEWLEAAILNHFYRGENVPPPQVFLALYLSDPTDADIGLEVNGEGYIPQPITFSEPEPRENETGHIINNSTEIRFPTAGADWGLITHIGIRTAATDGNLLSHTPLRVPREIKSGDEAVFPINTVTVSVD